MGHTGKGMEESVAETDLNCGGLARDTSKEKHLSMHPRDPSCDIFVKNVAVFCLCLNILPEVKLQIFGLTAFAGEISKQPSVDCVLWLLMAVPIEIYNKNEQAKQGKLQNVQLEEKWGTGNRS